MRHDIMNELTNAYGTLVSPSYAFAAQRLEAGMHADTVRRLARDFTVEDETSLGSDDVCITLYVRPREEAGAAKWCVQLSLVGDFGVVSEMVSTGPARKVWPITEARTACPSEAKLLGTLRSAGLELLPYAVLEEPTPFRPPNADADEVYTVYNALFTDAVPYPLRDGGGASNAEAQ